MRIGVNCFLLQKDMGGLRQQFHRLFRELLDTDLKNSYVFFYFEQNIEEMEKIGNERWKEGAVLIQDQKEVLNHLDKIDLYFCPFNALWPRPVPLPSVVMLNDIQEKYYPEFFTEQDLWNRKYHYDSSTKAADQVITVSEFSRDSIAHHHHISKKKIHVAYLAPDKDFFQPPISEDNLKLNLPDRFIFYPANRWFHKNHENLLKALLTLKKNYDLIVDCVLTGFDYEGNFPLAEKIKEYGLEDQVTVAGYVKKEELIYIYNRAEMLCFPSLFEGFGMPLVEAMAAGCPVICSNTACIPEITGDAALHFNPEDPEDIANTIQKVWFNKELQKTLIDKGRERAKRFSVKNLAKDHLEAFNLAAKSYNKNRYLFYKYIYEPLYTLKMFSKKP